MISLKEKKTKKHLLLLILAAAAWRLLFIGLWGPLSFPDSPAYEGLARNLLAGKGYVDTRPFQVMDASLIRTPGYPLFLAGVQAIFPGQGLPLILIQQILGLMTVVLIYWTGGILADEKTGFRAGMLCALHPWLAIFGNIVMTETLFLFLLVLAILLLVAGVQNNNLPMILLAGSLFGLSVLVRPAFLLFPLLLPAGLFVWQKKAGPAWRGSLLFGASCLLVLLPWVAWNRAHKGYAGLSAFSGINLLTLVQPPRSFYSTGDPVQRALAESCRNRGEEVPALIPAEVGRSLVYRQVTMPCTYLAVKSLREQGYPQPVIDRRFFSLALSYIMRNPLDYLRSAGRQMMKLWSGYSLEWLGGKFAKRAGQNLKDGEGWVWWLKAFARAGLGGLLALLTAWGAWRIARREPRLLILLLLLASITLTCGFITAADPRYRLPAEPFIMLVILRGLKRQAP